MVTIASQDSEGDASWRAASIAFPSSAAIAIVYGLGIASSSRFRLRAKARIAIHNEGAWLGRRVSLGKHAK